MDKQMKYSGIVAITVFALSGASFAAELAPNLGPGRRGMPRRLPRLD